MNLKINFSLTVSWKPMKNLQTSSFPSIASEIFSSPRARKDFVKGSFCLWEQQRSEFSSVGVETSMD